MRIRLDKVASATRNLNLHQHVLLSDDIPASPGTVVVVRVLDDKAVYNQIEDVHGRMMTVHRGDIVAGVLGERRALRGYTGIVPASVRAGDVLHLLNLGGIVGHCTSAAPEVGPPARVEVLGSVLVFPQLGVRQGGQPASILPGPVPLLDHVEGLPPTVALVGTCMHAGKTAAASSLVRSLTARGLKVGAAKVTGVALRRDALEMLDHGAKQAFTFADAGLPSTTGDDVVAAARGCMAAAGAGMDVLVVELGDGLLGDYGVGDVLAAADIAAQLDAVVLAAADPVGAWGGARILDDLGLPLTAVTGPATDNAAGNDAIALHAGAPAANARKQPELLADHVMAALGLALPQPQLRAVSA